MEHAVPHEISQTGACECFCNKCWDNDDKRCICQHCSHNEMVRLHPAYFGQAEGTVKETTPDHTCKDCGTEVFRNGTRGRFPKLCPDCKAK